MSFNNLFIGIIIFNMMITNFNSKSTLMTISTSENHCGSMKMILKKVIIFKTLVWFVFGLEIVALFFIVIK